jgi:hypothetical protein
MCADIFGTSPHVGKSESFSARRLRIGNAGSVVNDLKNEVRWIAAKINAYREKVFLMTKLDGRTKEEASRQINESLQRLQTDHIDLMQHHECIRLDDPDRIFAEGGAQEAMLEARKAGKIRYIGFTGHKDPVVHLRMLQTAAENGFHFDAVQMPLNVMDAPIPRFSAPGPADLFRITLLHELLSVHGWHCSSRAWFYR